MKLLDVLDYAEAHPEEWFAQIIENAWSEEDVRRFAKETKKADFKRIRPGHGIPGLPGGLRAAHRLNLTRRKT